MLRLSSVSKLTITGKLSITSIRDMPIPITPDFPNSIHRSDAYEALRESWRALYLNMNTKRKGCLETWIYGEDVTFP